MTTTSLPYYSTSHSNNTTELAKVTFALSELKRSEDVTFALSAITATFGTITNAMSLSYFVMKIRSCTLTKNRDASSTKLFVALNVFDLLLSVSALTLFTSFKMYDGYTTFRIVSCLMYYISLYGTSYLTCVLAMVRAICFIFPFHLIKWLLVLVSMGIYSAVLMAALLTTWLSCYSHHSSCRAIHAVSTHVRLFIVVVIFLVVLASNAIAVGKLFFSQSETEADNAGKRRATITVGIISAIYCTCNIGFIVIQGIYLYSPSSYQNIPTVFEEMFIYILLPLNSALNPLVYMTRNRDMRIYLYTLWRRLTRVRRNKEANSAGPDLRGARQLTQTLTLHETV